VQVRPAHDTATDSKQSDSYQRLYRGADKSLVRPGRKQATATEDFDFHISYL
jgi:molybdopterin-guanine dinucleotide biosynthesis protein